MFYRFAAEVQLRWADVDSAGVINNAVFLSLMEQARFLYFQHLGLITDFQVPFLLAEANVKFLRPGRLGMKTEVAARTAKLGSSSFHQEYEVRVADDVIASGQAALVFVDSAMRSRPIPADWRASIEQFEEMATGS